MAMALNKYSALVVVTEQFVLPHPLQKHLA
jgi:hypothetical protein